MDHTVQGDGTFAVDVRPVILCGGHGARLWPVSTPARPKPFQRLTGRDSLLQETVRRLTGPDFLDPVIVCAEEHARLVERQLKAIGRSPALMVVESTPRGTAAAAALGALAALSLADGARILIAPADHAVADPAALRAAIRDGAARGDGRIVLFGARPDRVEPGYGHILPFEPEREDGLRAVDRFIEKPDAPRAVAMRAEDGWLWNTGLFLSDPDRLLAAIERHAPHTHHAALAAWSVGRTARRRRPVALTPLDPRIPASLDRAVIEHCDSLAVISCDIGWRDVGCWRSIWSAGGRDTADNRLNGPATVVDSSGCLVWSSGPPVAVIGLSDIVVVTTAEGVLVMPRDRAQEVGALSRIS